MFFFVTLGEIDVAESSVVDLTPNFLVAHAGGAHGNLTYTNSLEALNQNYEKGLRFFELDFSFTVDGVLALIHDWEHTYRKYFNGKRVPTEEEFKKLETKADFKQLVLSDLYSWLETNKYTYIVTDTKDNNKALLKIISQSELKDRFIPQVYNEEELDYVAELNFDEVILSLYKSEFNVDQVLRLAKKHDLFAVTMNRDRAKKGNLALRLKEAGFFVYVHTINNQSEVEELLKVGAQGFYTDFLD